MGPATVAEEIPVTLNSADEIDVGENIKQSIIPHGKYAFQNYSKPNPGTNIDTGHWNII